MPHNRFYIPYPLPLHETLTLEGKEANHLKVMRIKEGEAIELVNGKGVIAKAKILKIKRGQTSVRIEKVEKENKPILSITLAQALPNLNHLEIILEKGTELGVDTFLLFPGKRSEKGALTNTQLKRLERITIAAMKQCGRLYLPKITLMPPLKDWPTFPKKALFGDVRKKAPLLKDALPKEAAIAFFTGPEGGFTEGEIALLESANVQGVCLHPLTLRAETASLTALSLLAHLTIVVKSPH